VRLLGLLGLLNDDFAPERHGVRDDHRAPFRLGELDLLECIGDALVDLGVFHGRLHYRRFLDGSEWPHGRFDRDRTFEFALFVRTKRVTRIECLDVVVDGLLNLGIRQTPDEWSVGARGTGRGCNAC
jgi:hypothetical protein